MHLMRAIETVIMTYLVLFDNLYFDTSEFGEKVVESIIEHLDISKENTRKSTQPTIFVGIIQGIKKPGFITSI